MEVAKDELVSETADSLYVSASLKMRNREYRKARADLLESLAIFHKQRNQRSVQMVQSKIEQLDMVEMQELGRLLPPESRRAIRSAHACNPEDQIFLEKLTTLQDEEDRVLTRVRSQRILTLAMEPIGRSAADPSAAGVSHGSRASTASLHRSASRSRRSLYIAGSHLPNDDDRIGGTTGTSHADVTFTDGHTDLLRLHADGEELLEAGLLELEDGRLLEARERFLQAADAFTAADMPDLASDADAHADAVGHTVRVAVEAAAFHAAADLDVAADWDGAAHRAAADALLGAASTFGRLGRSGDEAALRRRGGSAAWLAAAADAREDAAVLVQRGDFSAADSALELAEAALRAALELEVEHWLGDGDGTDW
jgi:hypothetical protein